MMAFQCERNGGKPERKPLSLRPVRVMSSHSLFFCKAPQSALFMSQSLIRVFADQV